MDQDTIRARRIELVDETGTPRAILEAGSQSVSGLMLSAVGGRGITASIGVDRNDSPFLLLGSEEKGRIFAGATPDGPVVRVIDKNGEEAVLSV
jgi:hypothetical protein